MKRTGRKVITTSLVLVSGVVFDGADVMMARCDGSYFFFFCPTCRHVSGWESFFPSGSCGPLSFPRIVGGMAWPWQGPTGYRH